MHMEKLVTREYTMAGQRNQRPAYLRSHAW